MYTQYRRLNLEIPHWLIYFFIRFTSSRGAFVLAVGPWDISYSFLVQPWHGSYPFWRLLKTYAYMHRMFIFLTPTPSSPAFLCVFLLPSGESFLPLHTFWRVRGQRSLQYRMLRIGALSTNLRMWVRISSIVVYTDEFAVGTCKYPVIFYLRYVSGRLFLPLNKNMCLFLHVEAHRPLPMACRLCILKIKCALCVDTPTSKIYHRTLCCKYQSRKRNITSSLDTAESAHRFDESNLVCFP